MKKRLLALALCLVMMTSLLPLTAAAATVDKIVITGSGFGSTSNADWGLQNGNCNVTVDGKENATGFTGLAGGLHKDEALTMPLHRNPVDGETYYFGYDIVAPETTISFSNLTINNCILTVNGYSTACVKLEPDLDNPSYLQIIFQVTKKHNWQFTVSKNNDTLTAECQNQGCPTKEVSVTLKADSVTLPNSPFKAARLEGKEQFETATGAAISKIRYDYKGSDGVWHKDVDPIAANAKAGEYQAFVQVSNLLRPVEYDGVVAMAENPDGTYTADLFVHYTAVDPAVTAQTGDKRPIELMVASVVVFSALAAAAFIADSKRRSQQ